MDDDDWEKLCETLCECALNESEKDFAVDVFGTLLSEFMTISTFETECRSQSLSDSHTVVLHISVMIIQFFAI